MSLVLKDILLICSHALDGTLFFLIFTYLDFIIIQETMAQLWQYVIFLSLKPSKVTSDFILNQVVEKTCRASHPSEILKTNTKTLLHSIWICPQGFLGCQKMGQGPLNMQFKVWCANIASKLKNIQKSLRKQVFFDIFFRF